MRVEARFIGCWDISHDSSSTIMFSIPADYDSVNRVDHQVTLQAIFSNGSGDNGSAGQLICHEVVAFASVRDFIDFEVRQDVSRPPRRRANASQGVRGPLRW